MTHARDFLGRYLKPGQYVAYADRGSRYYGLLLMRVKNVTDDTDHTGHGKIVCERLRVSYSKDEQSGNMIAKAYIKEVTISNTNTLVVVDNPRAEIDRWFNAIEFTEDESRRIGKWIRGGIKVF